MAVFVKARSFLRTLFMSRAAEVDLDEEIRAHLEMLTDERVRAGLSRGDAERAARIELGGIDQVKEQVRDAQVARLRDGVSLDQATRGSASVRQSVNAGPHSRIYLASKAGAPDVLIARTTSVGGTEPEQLAVALRLHRVATYTESNATEEHYV